MRSEHRREYQAAWKRARRGSWTAIARIADAITLAADLATRMPARPDEHSRIVPVFKGRARSARAVAFAIVDADSFDELRGHWWHITTGGYAARSVGKTCAYLHRDVLGPGVAPGVVDHINRNKLDCRRSNLRHVESWLNSHNTTVNNGRTSRFRGVSLSRRTDLQRPWRADAKIKGERFHANFATELEAARAIAAFKAAHGAPYPCLDA